MAMYKCIAIIKFFFTIDINKLQLIPETAYFTSNSSFQNRKNSVEEIVDEIYLE